MGLIGVLLYMVMDSAISLDHSRSQNQYLRHKCELLAKLASDGLRGRSIDSVKHAGGTDVIAKAEGNELWLDDIAIKIVGGKVADIDVAETCH